MANTKTDKTKLRKSQIFTKFYQFWYLTISNFNNNNLWDSACSCSFGFVFSFVPIALIIITILISVLKGSPALLNYIYEFCAQIEDIIDLKPLINNLVNLKSLRFADIFLAFWIIWMARRLFLSIVRGMDSIFHSHVKQKGLFIQLFTFLSEFVMIFVFIALTILTFTFNKVFVNSMYDNSLFSFFRYSFPFIFRQRSTVIISSFTYFLLFIFTFYIYKVVSGSKPRFRICAFYAALSTGGFFVFSFFMNKFMNMTNYNIVYGTISTLIILMAKVYFFFVIFLFCAQMVYISQFFDSLLLAEMYLLPKNDVQGFIPNLRRKTFMNSTVLENDANTIHIKAGETLYTKGEPVDKVFYLRSGEVWEENENLSMKYSSGTFFGELPLIINTQRLGTATALTDCELLHISAEKFLELVKESPRISAQAIEQLKRYTAK